MAKAMWNEGKEVEGLLYFGLALRQSPSRFLLPVLGRAGKAKAASSSGAHGCPRIFYPIAGRLGHISPRHPLCPWRLLPLGCTFLGLEVDQRNGCGLSYQENIHPYDPGEKIVWPKAWGWLFPSSGTVSQRVRMLNHNLTL